MRCPCPCVVAACLLIVFLWTGACSDAAGPAFLGSALAGEPCVTDLDCDDYGDPCTIEKCVFDPDIGSSACEPFYQMLCLAELPYRKSFDGADQVCGPPLVPGWSISDSGNDATKNWCVVSKGALGPDEHLRFLWYPTTAMVRSTAATPLIDASSSGTSAFNPELATTVQWRMAYRHSVPGEPVTLSVVMTDDSDFADGNVVWQQTVTDDIEYNLYSFQLDNSLKFAPTLQIGFMVNTGAATTFNMDAWEIDDLLVAEGVSNTLAKTMLFRCQTNVCNLADQAVLVSETVAAVPDVTMTVSDHYKYVLCYRDPDFSSTQAQYWGRPHAFLDGPPMDQTPFAAPVDMTGFGSSCFWVPAGVDAMCGQGVANYFCIIDVDPAADPANVGEYRIGIVGQDEWKADPTGYNHSPFQSLNKADLRVLPDSGYLVWSPLGKDRFAAQAIRAAIEAAGRPAYVVEDILKVPDLAPYDGVFATLGVKGYARDPTWEEASALDHYLDGGGRLYLEGGDYWYRGPTEEVDATLFPYFGVDGLWGGSKALEGQITGTGFLDGTGFDYDAGPYCAFYNEGLAPAQQSGAVEFMSHAGEPAFPVVVANESEKWRVIGSSVLFGCLKEKDLGTTDHLMHQYLYYLINGLP